MLKMGQRENLHIIAFTIAQEDGEDVVETYEARDGKKPPIERELDDTNESQSNVIECDEELPVVPDGDEEGANEKTAEAKLRCQITGCRLNFLSFVLVLQAPPLG